MLEGSSPCTSRPGTPASPRSSSVRGYDSDPESDRAPLRSVQQSHFAETPHRERGDEGQSARTGTKLVLGLHVTNTGWAQGKHFPGLASPT